MLSREDNELLTRVGPGTPCGELLRRYWMPVCAAADITDARPKKRIRVMGENLVLFRDGKGRYGLLPEQCPHRNASLYYGFVEEDGLRCAYHGWKFGADGQCIDQPFEAPTSALKARACRRSYPVQQMAGLLFAYFGPEPAPLLPRWETCVRKDGLRSIVVLPVHRCNWLQAQENSHDPTHTQWLHARMLERELSGEEKKEFEVAIAYFGRPIESFEFELCREPAWTGIRKVRTFGGDQPEKELGHPAIFPHMLVAPQGKPLVVHWRTPVDDENTAIFWLEFVATKDGSTVEQDDSEIPVTHLAHTLKPNGEYDLTSFMGQDLMAWETQGRIFDRTRELIGAGDKGVVMYRKLLKEQILAVQRGEEPTGIIRDPKLNEMIRFSQVTSGFMRAAREREEAHH